MKVLFALAGLVAASAAYPMFLLEEEPAYEPVYRVARQAPQMADDFVAPSRFAQAARRRIQEEEDLVTAADAAYGAAVSFIFITYSFILQLYYSLTLTLS